MCKKNCLNCQHGTYKYYSATREDPEDYDFDCAREDDVPEELFDVSSEMSIDEAFEYVGEHCPCFEDVIAKCTICGTSMGAERLIARDAWVNTLYGDPAPACEKCKPDFTKRMNQARKEFEEVFTL